MKSSFINNVVKIDLKQIEKTMKTTLLLILSLITWHSTFAQSKKDMEQNILQLEEKIKSIEGEITNIKTNLINTTTTLGMVSKSNLDL